ncbi:MAG: hypothetical protein RML35_09290 [Chloroherpetonaceae bacterium]|nr:hypothetical protein [Chloroherpetonaceae bacterium]
MQKLELKLSEQLTEEQKIEAYFNEVNRRLVVAIALSPAFFDAIQQQASELLRTSSESPFADDAETLTFDGVQVFIKQMGDDFKIINSEEEFNLLIKEQR